MGHIQALSSFPQEHDITNQYAADPTKFCPKNIGVFFWSSNNHLRSTGLSLVDTVSPNAFASAADTAEIFQAM